MSREVVGSAGVRPATGRGDERPPDTDLRHRLLPGAQPVPSTSLDATGAPVELSWRGLPDPEPDAPVEEPPPPERTGFLRGRRRLVAVAAAAVLVGALVGNAVAARSALREAQSVASVQAWLEVAPGRASADAVSLTLRVVNTGSAPLRVEAVRMDGGLDAPGPVRAVLEEPAPVAPGLMRSFAVDAQSGCEGRPIPSDSPSDGRLQLQLRTADGREQLVTPGTPTGLTSADVQESFCGQAGTRLGLTVSAMQPRPGGEMAMSLLNDSPRALTLEFSAPAGTRVVSDTPLPMTIRSGLRTSVVVRLEVDACTNDAQRVQAGDDVQLVIDGRQRRGGLDGQLIGAWVAQRVAQEC